MKQMDKQVVLVTGATDGHGRGVALELARRGATVLVHGRDPARIERVAAEVRRIAVGEVRSYRADFASCAQVRALADEISAKEPRLHVLVNNAGIGTDIPGGGERMLSDDGLELRFAVNYLAHVLLTRRLLPLLRASSPSRIVNVSSAGQAPLDFTDLMLERGYSGTRAYCQSKLAQILFTMSLAEELAGSGVSVNALHPATYMPTKLVPAPMSSLESGVDATVRLVAEAGLANVSGCYFDGVREAPAHPQAYDPEARRRLREETDALIARWA